MHWKDHGSRVSTSSYIIVDGVVSPGRFLEGKGETFRTGIRSGKDLEVPFVFANIPMDMPMPPCSNGMGTIELKIMLVDRGRQRINNDPQVLMHHRADALNRLNNHRDSYRAVTNAIPQECAEQTLLTWEGNPLEIDRQGHGRSYVKFKFHYRLLDWLEMCGLLNEKPHILSADKIAGQGVYRCLSTTGELTNFVGCFQLGGERPPEHATVRTFTIIVSQH